MVVRDSIILVFSCISDYEINGFPCVLCFRSVNHLIAALSRSRFRRSVHYCSTNNSVPCRRQGQVPCSRLRTCCRHSLRPRRNLRYLVECVFFSDAYSFYTFIVVTLGYRGTSVYRHVTSKVTSPLQSAFLSAILFVSSCDKVTSPSRSLLLTPLGDRIDTNDSGTNHNGRVESAMSADKRS